MTGKRFEPPRPSWSILARLSALAAASHHESDGRSIRTMLPLNPGPVEATIDPDPCPPIPDAGKRELDRSLSRTEDSE